MIASTAITASLQCTQYISKTEQTMFVMHEQYEFVCPFAFFEVLNRAAGLVMVLMAMTARAHEGHNTYARTSRKSRHVWIAWVSGRLMHYAPLKKVPNKRGRKSDMRERERGQGRTGLGVRGWQGHGDLNTTCVSERGASSCVCNNPIVKVRDEKDRPARTHLGMQ